MTHLDSFDKPNSSRVPRAVSLIRALGCLLALSLAGCAQELSVRSDVGEIFTVPKSTISQSDFDWAKVAEIRRQQSQLANMGPDFCSGDMAWLGMNSACSNQQSMIEADKRRIDLLNKWSQKPQKLLVTISYRIIKTDLNGSKSPGSYESVDCVNPALSEDEKVELQEASGFNGPAQGSAQVTEAIKAQLCDKHAEFGA